MKRHNAKAIAAAVAIAAAAANPETKKKSEPKPTMSAAALYVDVVKNMAKAETPPSATSPLPKFTILHEDFPALPGTVEETTRVINANVPDDWTDMISDNDDLNDDEDDEDGDVDDDDGDDDAEDIDDDEQSASPSPTLDSVSEKPESLPDANEPETSIPDLLMELHSSSSNNKSSESSEHDAPAVVHVSASTDHSNANSNGSEWQHSPKCKHFRPNFCECANESFFEPQFLIAGMQQRALERQKSSEVKTQLGPPPGFERLVYYGRLCTNRMGMPLGGVTFDNVAPPTAAAANNAQLSSGKVLKDAFGMAGLARNLQAVQQNPRMVQFFGHKVACLNHCSTHEANKLHANFAGALMGGRCPPHEVQHNVPPYYYRSSFKALPQPKMDQMESELLFFFFYTYPNDMLQMLAAAELADRGWRYHIEERLWIRRQPDNPHYVASRCQESGEYNYFNMMHWKIMPRHFELLSGQLEQTITKAELYEQYGYHPQMSFFC
ncbi:uncharacterized protein LOC133837354 isoform X1 [Drosophila sulfurigaster albostrigata]|uniref:uncharacterized protein LOC133837354 isoform X1 n=2 Tax=Drosophila sulfurigaster albostrigata TaxID=89887 RepID=UPI002D219A4F|nr:uncharacterized protein LOC133837354 isoform X1 [Drosophila sulfurigaster albostrigata]